jgi:hypothetical protein
MENNKWIENKVIKDWIEDKNINNWMKEDLNEFKKVGKRLITEVLHWCENTASSIRLVYNRTLRTTTWKKKKKKEELEHDAKGMRTLNTLFLNAEASTNVILLELLQSLQPKIPSSSSSFQSPSLVTKEITRNPTSTLK